MNKTIEKVLSWANETFPNSTPNSTHDHFQDEAKELKDAMELLTICKDVGSYAMVEDEIADCFILLVQVADKLKIDIERVTKKKLKINMTRKWGEPDERGVVKHV